MCNFDQETIGIGTVWVYSVLNTIEINEKLPERLIPTEKQVQTNTPKPIHKISGTIIHHFNILRDECRYKQRKKYIARNEIKAIVRSLDILMIMLINGQTKCGQRGCLTINSVIFIFDCFLLCICDASAVNCVCVHVYFIFLTALKPSRK